MHGLSILLSVISNPGLQLNVQQFNSIPVILTQEQVVQYGLIAQNSEKKTQPLDITLVYNGVVTQAHRFFYVKSKNQWGIKS